METESIKSANEKSNHQPLANMNALQSYLTEKEEMAFMHLLYSSSATIRAGNFGLSRKDVAKILEMSPDDDDGFYSFINRVNQGLSRYYKVIYDKKRDQVIVMLRATARMAKSTLSPEAMAILLLMFYQQEVLQHEFTLLSQLFEAFGHEQLKASQKLKVNIDTLRKIGAVVDYHSDSDEEAYQLTAIGVNMFSDSFLRRAVEFSQSQQFNKDEVLKFFKRYNVQYSGDDSE
ncbi:hypothetical protein HNQ35_001964 [Cerasibacillus quisquiliarum]|uniref:Uncharacterized protein n=1 Tax=Cerasibacillus quisquiliarum TaxID=227865 RepID=A0A511UY44_9BACI|nr:hypothetical protein [Cerasibacillus quisquiliarum]MBB5146754.1 hypothetical protein [Cerasibacillus quisquiliarum]GEN31554.1 hypothetical protein CQU01_17920 [Cerasibacillus quisquiliarum]